jgi:hypothetical protein
MSKKLEHMAGLVAMAAVLVLSPAAEANAQGHSLLTGVVIGAGIHKLAQAHHQKQEQKKADAAAGLPAKPSVMGKEFDDTLKERLAKVKAERDAHKPSGLGFVDTFKQRLATARAAQRQEVAEQRGAAPKP